MYLRSSVLAFGLLAAMVGGYVPGVSDTATAQTLTAERLDDRIRIEVDGTHFTSYRYADTLKYPYFYPVNGPGSGRSVTAESARPWPHHRSLFFACDRVNGGNYWQEGLDRGQIRTESVTLPVASGDSVVVAATSRWNRPDAAAPLRDRRRLVVRAPSPELRVIDWTITLTALQTVTIRQSNHSLFAARMAPALSVDSGGVLINAEGDLGEEETWGRRAAWADYSGSRNGRTEGLAILTHPGNPWHPAPWFTRDYGFFSPTPMQWLADGRFDLAEGDSLTLRYRVLVHTGDARRARISEQYERWTRGALD